MDSVTILRDLWRHRLAVVGVLLLALLASTLVLYKFSPPLQLESRKYPVGVATTSVLIDTPSSQVAEIAPEGTDQLGVRAVLLARLMVDGVVKAEIAKAAGLDPDELFAISTADSGEPVSAAAPRGAPMLTTEVVLQNNGTQLPIIQIEAQAVDAASAAKVADAAVQGLRGYLDRQAADTQVPDQRRVKVSRFGATQVVTAVRGPKNVFAFVAGLFVFGLGCCLIIGFAALVRSWHTEVAAEQPWSDDDVAWLTEARVGAPKGEPPGAIPGSPLRAAEPIRPVAPLQPSPLRPADGARPATESTQDDIRPWPDSQAKPRARDQRRRSAS